MNQILASVLLLAVSCGKSASSEIQGGENPSGSQAVSSGNPSGSQAVAGDSELLEQLGYADYVEVANPDVRPSGVVVKQPEAVSPGWNLLSVHKKAAALLLDERGEVVRRWQSDGLRWGACQLLANGDLLVPEMGAGGRLFLRRLDWQGNTLWTTAGGRDGKDDFLSHHDVEVRPDGLISTLSRRTRQEDDVDVERSFGDESIALINPKTGAVIEQQSFYDMWSKAEQPLPWLEQRWMDLPGTGGRIDLFHANSVEWMHQPELEQKSDLFQSGNVLVSFRHQACVAIFNWAEQRLVWQWGRGEISGSHDATVLSNGNILIFDNGLGRGWSRVVEVDPLSNEIVWQYAGESQGELWSKSRGSSQRLANGNTLLCESDQGRAREVSADGEVVWEYWHPAQEDGKVLTIVRMKRIDGELLQSVKQLDRESTLQENDASVDDEQRPNVVIIFTDDQGYGDVGVHGATGFETPHLDQLAAQGLQLTDFYVAPVCTPSRAQLMTGRYAFRMELGNRVLFPFSDGGLPAEEWTMAEALREAGYRTGMVGKWHLGHQPQFHPMKNGFDEFYGVPYSNDMNSHFYQQNKFQSPPLPVYRGEKVIEEDPNQALLTKRYTEEAQAFMRRNQEQPFFLYLAHSMPHKPIYASEDFAGKSELGLYGDVIEEIDWSVGQLMSTLDELKLAQNTIVIFTSDNGPWRPESSGGLRGKKASTWEGGMRVPCLLRWPNSIAAGGKCSTPLMSMDLLPTLAAWTQAPLGKSKLDGADVGALLTGGASTSVDDRVIRFYRNNKLQAVRQGQWKLHVWRPEWRGKKPKPSPMLFDLSANPNEKIDVAADHPEVVAALQKIALKIEEQP
jgi:arylsulfatase A